VLLDARSGTVWACGANGSGQCGAPGGGSVAALSKVAFPALGAGAPPRITAVAAAGGYSAALDDAGGFLRSTRRC
jgi:hypothetical protein